MKNKVESLRTPSAPTSTLETVTPEMATAWLEKMGPNRSVSRRTVDRYARDMASGRWEVTGSSIGFDANGKLRDGQHRLRACVLAEVPFQTYVVRGITENAVTVIDIGKRRSTGDMLQMREYAGSMRLGAASRWLLSIKSGLPHVKSRTTIPTHVEILDVVERHPHLSDSCRMAETTKGIVSPSLLAAIHYIGAYILDKPDEADAYVQTYTTGISNKKFYNDPQGDPAFRMRERLISFRQAYARPDGVTYNGLITAWNMYADHKVVGRMFIVPKDTPSIEGLDVNVI